MHRLLILILACVFGCNLSSQKDDERAPKSVNLQDDANAPARNTLSPIAVPRPNSGEFSAAEATVLLPQFLQRSIPVQKTDAIVTQWKSPTQGIRVHVTAENKVEIIDYLGNNLTGPDSLAAALDSTMTDGNERSVLLTSETEGWESPVRKTVIEKLLQPSVQIYLIGNNAG